MTEEYKQFLKFNAFAWVLFYWLLRTSQGVIFDKPLIYMAVDLSDTCIGFMQCLLLKPALDRFVGRKTLLRGFGAMIAIVASILIFKVTHDLIYQQVFPPEAPFSPIQSLTTGLNLPGYIFVVWTICYVAWQLVQQQARSREDALRATAAISALNAELVRRQMVPHFLFNTLNLLVATALKEQAFQTKELLVKFSELLRYVVERGENGISSLEKEVDFALDYMDIQSSRFGERIMFQHNLADLGEGQTAMAVPVLLIQPLLENIIQHAVEISKETIKINLDAALSDSGFNLTLSNTQPTQQASTPKEGSLGTGLASLNSRLRENFGSVAHVDVNDAPTVFSVTVFVPRMGGALDPK